MAEITKREKNIKELFIGKCWTFLHDNFHKFSLPNQIKVALELAKKDIPQEVTGQITYTSMSIIKVEQKPLVLDLGEDAPDDLTARRN